MIVDGRGNTFNGRWIDPSRLIALDSGGAPGVVRDSRIVWSDGAIWSKLLLFQGISSTCGIVSIDSRADQIELKNGSTRSRARLLSPDTLYAIDWRLTGVFVDGTIRWSNGTVWKDFGYQNFNAAFGDIETFPFPNLILKGATSRGGTVAFELRQNQLFATDRGGNTAPATLVAPGKVFVAAWSLTGTLKNGRMRWSNATVWQGFDVPLLDYVLGK